MFHPHFLTPAFLKSAYASPQSCGLVRGSHCSFSGWGLSGRSPCFVDTSGQQTRFARQEAERQGFHVPALLHLRAARHKLLSGAPTRSQYIYYGLPTIASLGRSMAGGALLSARAIDGVAGRKSRKCRRTFGHHPARRCRRGATTSAISTTTSAITFFAITFFAAHLCFAAAYAAATAFEAQVKAQVEAAIL